MRPEGGQEIGKKWSICRHDCARIPRAQGDVCSSRRTATQPRFCRRTLSPQNTSDRGWTKSIQLMLFSSGSLCNRSCHARWRRARPGSDESVLSSEINLDLPRLVGLCGHELPTPSIAATFFLRRIRFGFCRLRKTMLSRAFDRARLNGTSEARENERREEPARARMIRVRPLQMTALSGDVVFPVQAALEKRKPSARMRRYLRSLQFIV